MLEEQIKYLEAARNSGSLFYTRQKGEEEHFFTLKDRPDAAWLEKKTANWHYVLYEPDELPVQGWKIHLSATVKQAQGMLDAVALCLIKQKVSFKFQSSLEQYVESNSKYADRGESGKFITVYPRGEEEFACLLAELQKLTETFALGPYILSDQNWQESNVYFRYGGFKPLYLVNAAGERVPAIYDPAGNKVADQRLPYYQQADFVKDLPIFGKNTFPKQEAFAPLEEYQVKEALHFSNAGGVYLDLHEGKKVVLKEGRQQAGLDANLKDGFARVENEAEILRQLADLTGVVNYLDDFTSWRHHFLVEEYIAGQSLEELLATEFPFVVGDLEKKARYKAKAIKILEQLKELLKQIHARGLAVGDLSLSNILVTEDGDVRLIDLENAGKATEKYVPGLTTVGFVSRAAKTYAEADDFALARIAYYLFLPVIPVADLAPDIIAKQEKWIGGYFGQDLVQFLRKIAGNMQASEPIFLKKPLAIPEKDLSRQTVDFFTDGLTRGILRHSRFDQVGLVPNLHEKNADPMELLNLARGAAGILWAVGQNADLQAWVARNQGKIIKIAEESEATGLFNGLAGLASVLEKRDFPALAKQLRQILRQKVDLNMADNSLATGLTGIALALREEKPEVSEKIAEELAGRWKQVDFANFADEDVGLLTGWGGVSWLFWQLGQKEVAEEIVSRILRDHAEEAETLTISDQSRGFERLLPYLENGNFGLALLMHKFMREDPAFKQRYQLPFDKLKKSCLTYCTYMETLVSGYSGVLPLAKSLAGDGDYALLDYALAALNQYLVANNDEILAPGKYGYKLSLDFSTGSAGLLTLLKDLRQRDEFSWLPL
ncbi:serine/threonine protein kinase [Lactobacillus delbrueckii subsp. bulgaricus ATCC BAA-365]|uniref:class III lanthionine synthetase LanKC n=1 Tax=Lactobacillus delbrueckii TaxID=1584 RepID=UPI0000510700|nr:class III lanthionine synthetase LanKC [Lactobacillus delbrueckii]ABJ57719.1 serine/threonine protein kinase [Lactobacillus delbrueckii subsp. bulgaricus ATCC BAA-365]MBT8938570.1 serine/threonine protein kinase [Lactobacillus delbrueckii subsp. bulgaricus]